MHTSKEGRSVAGEKKFSFDPDVLAVWLIPVLYVVFDLGAAAVCGA